MTYFSYNFYYSKHNLLARSFCIIIPLLVVIQYSLNEMILSNILNINMNIIEIIVWSILTALLLINIIRINEEYNNMDIISTIVCNECMLLTGYGLYFIEDLQYKYILFGVSSIFYLLLLYILYTIYMKSNIKFDQSLIISTFLLWTFYPLITFFYIQNFLDYDIKYLLFMILNIIIKGVGPFITIGYYDVVERKFKSISSYFVLQRVAISPEEILIDTNGNIIPKKKRRNAIVIIDQQLIDHLKLYLSKYNESPNI
jgi:hypothetical protein